ncbi:MAG: hypothetical protein ACUVT7_01680 [Thermoplasmata archaeon]
MAIWMTNGPFEGKIMRFLTSLVLPVDANRSGGCKKCGGCCMFLFKCPFLRFDKGNPGSATCRAYIIRPPQCRKYPRTRGEQIHQPCGYYFRDSRD